VAVDFSNALGGGAVGRALVAIGVAISTMGSCNGSILTGGRLFYAVARSRDVLNDVGPKESPGVVNGNNEESDSGDTSEGADVDGGDNGAADGIEVGDSDIVGGMGGVQLFPSFFGHLNANGAPARVLIAQAVWATALLLAPGSSFASLLDYFGPVSEWRLSN